MVVYIESNFVLEMALQQEEFKATQQIMNLAHASQLEIKCPVFALIEPFWTIEKESKKRADVYNAMQTQSVHFQRSGLHQNIATLFENATQEMKKAITTEQEALNATIIVLMQSISTINITARVVEAAFKYKNDYKWGMQDAVIFASVIEDLQQQNSTELKCFVSRDIQAFGRLNAYERQIKTELAGYNCQLKLSFGGALSFVQGNPSQP